MKIGAVVGDVETKVQVKRPVAKLAQTSRATLRVEGKARGVERTRKVRERQETQPSAMQGRSNVTIISATGHLSGLLVAVVGDSFLFTRLRLLARSCHRSSFTRRPASPPSRPAQTTPAGRFGLGGGGGAHNRTLH